MARYICTLAITIAALIVGLEAEGVIMSKCLRADLFPLCMFEESAKSLWCDHSNYTTLATMKGFTCDEVKCQKIMSLYVNDSCLTEISDKALNPYSGLRRLWLGDNYIGEIKSNTFQHNHKLNHVDLCRNNISKLHQNAFKGLTNLEELNLDGNKLSQYHFQRRSLGLRHLFGLNRLSLQGNNFTRISRNLLENKQLKVLNLQENGIKTIHDGAFSKLPNLEELNLDGNLLKIVTSRTFQGLQKLSVLTLSHNNLTVWSIEIQKNLVKLEVLHIGNNPISHVEPRSFENMTQLQELRLQNISISVVDDEWFSGASQLRHIDLSLNGLTNLSSGTVQSLCCPKFVDLSNNELTHLDLGLIHWAAENSDIHIDSSGNKWRCDCSILEVQRLLHNKYDRDLSEFNVTCHSPNYAQGRLPDDELRKEVAFREKCSSRPPSQPVKVIRKCEGACERNRTFPSREAYKPKLESKATSRLLKFHSQSSSQPPSLEGSFAIRVSPTIHIYSLMAIIFKILQNL